MNAAANASRAVLAAYTKKALRPVEIIAIIVFVLFLIGTAYLIVNVSAWWWLMMIVVGAYGLIGSALWLMLHFTIEKLAPVQTKAQKAAVNAFISRVEKIADLTGMTRFGLLFRVVQDVMTRRDANILSDLAHESKDLKQDFERVIAVFR